MSFNPANITALVIAASFAAGLNIYATVLTLGILARTQWVALPPGLDSLGHTWILVVCGIMFAMEFVADKIPAFDPGVEHPAHRRSCPDCSTGRVSRQFTAVATDAGPRNGDWCSGRVGCA
jgi:hypothetical protein